MQNNLKIFICFFFLFIFLKGSSQQINWISFNELEKVQKNNPKNVLIDIYTNWCGPCKLMDKNTFGNADIIRIINENYYTCLLYTSPNPRDVEESRMPSSA